MDAPTYKLRERRAYYNNYSENFNDNTGEILDDFDDNDFYCVHCGGKWPSISLLALHTQHEHPNVELPFKCDRLNVLVKDCLQGRLGKSSKREHHKSPGRETSARGLKESALHHLSTGGTQTSKKTKKISSLSVKQTNKSGNEFEFKCEHCSRSYETKISLERHTRREHVCADEKRTCPVCGKKFTRAHKVRVRVRVFFFVIINLTRKINHNSSQNIYTRNCNSLP